MIDSVVSKLNGEENHPFMSMVSQPCFLGACGREADVEQAERLLYIASEWLVTHRMGDKSNEPMASRSAQQ